MRVHLINPSDVSFGVGVITPRWLFVLAAATPAKYGVPVITDETLEQFDPASLEPGDIVGIGIHTANAHRGFNLGRELRERGAWVVYGGIHATLYPEEARDIGKGHAVVKGDGDVVWADAIADCVAGNPQPVYDGGRVAADRFLPARWDLLPEKKYMWASVQTVRGCPKHCSFCSVWRTDGQTPRQRGTDVIVQEIVELRRLGYRFIALADDNFYPVTLEDIELAQKQKNEARVASLLALREEDRAVRGGLEPEPHRPRSLDLRRSLGQQPDARTYTALGVVVWQAGRADEAVTLLKQALEADANYAPARDKLAEILRGSVASASRGTT